MKLRCNFEIMELDDYAIAVPIGEGAEEFRIVIKLNDSAFEIFKLLENETTESSVINELKKRYNADPNIEENVHSVINYLLAEGVLE